MTTAVLFDTQFELIPTGGGQRRACQIANLIRKAGFEPVRFDLNPRQDVGNRVIRGLQYFRKSPIRFSLSLNSVRNFGFAVNAYEQALACHEGARLLVRERTNGAGVAASMIAHQLGYRTIALPPNIESLVPNQVDPLTGRSGLKGLHDEISLLGAEDAVFCISREEQWLLNVSGISADYMPYYPPLELSADLVKVRAAREPGNPKVFLVLGSVNNPPVLQGMIELVHMAGPLAARHGYRLEVVGNATEQYRKDLSADGVVVRGRLADDELQRLMTSCSAALAYQRQGCGALTRIPELLLAGVPVIANGNAARSAYHYSGVHIFETISELEKLMCTSLPTPSVLHPPSREEMRFIETVQRLAEAA